MELPERAFPVRMRRVAVVALASGVREVLVALAESGTVDLSGPLGSGEGPALEALRRLERRAPAGPRPAPALARECAGCRRARAPRRPAAAGRRGRARAPDGERRRSTAALRCSSAGRRSRRSRSSSGRSRRSGLRWSSSDAPRGVEPPTLLAPAPAAEPVPAAADHLRRGAVRGRRSDAVRGGHVLPDVRDDVRGRRRRAADRARPRWRCAALAIRGCRRCGRCGR